MTRCTCCGGRLEPVRVRVTAWGRISAIRICSRCDLALEPLQAWCDERDRLEQEDAG